MSTSEKVVERTARRGSISQTVISVVAEATGKDPTDLEPLYNRIDPDALERLFQASPVDTDDPDGQITFSLDGCSVVVKSDNTVVASPEDTH